MYNSWLQLVAITLGLLMRPKEEMRRKEDKCVWF